MFITHLSSIAKPAIVSVANPAMTKPIVILAGQHHTDDVRSFRNCDCPEIKNQPDTVQPVPHLQTRFQPGS